MLLLIYTLEYIKLPTLLNLSKPYCSINYMKENPYFNLFKGEQVPLSKITELVPNMGITVKSCIRSGLIVGQGTLDGDVILWIPNRVFTNIKT